MILELISGTDVINEQGHSYDFCDSAHEVLNTVKGGVFSHQSVIQ